MMKLSRDVWLAIGLIIFLVVVTGVAAIQQTEQRLMPPLASYSAQPNGAKALRLWLDALHYRVYETESSFLPSGQSDLLLILSPTFNITSEEWQALDLWVEAGGTVIIAGDNLSTRNAFSHYQVSFSYTGRTASTLGVQMPLWQSPPLQSATLRADTYFISRRDNFVTHIAMQDKPIIISFEQGAGRVLLSATAYPFSNAGMKEPGNPALVLNLLSTIDQADAIWFDEWHHGQRAAQLEIIGPLNWLRYTPTGRALLYAAFIIFLGLILQGQRFGRPVPLGTTLSRRAPLAYITAIANLGRRAGHRGAVLSHYRQQLKRALGRRYRLNPTLTDEDYLRQLAALNPNLDINALRNLLIRLNRRQVSEGEMIQLAAEASTWLKE